MSGSCRTVSMTVGELDKVSFRTGEDGSVVFAGPELSFLSLPANRTFPYRTIKLLLPPEADLSSLSVSMEPVRTEPGIKVQGVRPAKPPVVRRGDNSRRDMA